MKRIITAIIALYTLCTLCAAQDVTADTIVIEQDSGTVEWVDVPEKSNSGRTITIDDDMDFLKGTLKNTMGWGILLSIIAIFCVFGLPLLIIFLVFYFQYKNRKAKYKLAEQALASGQPIPEDVVKSVSNTPDKNLLNKGIKNIFLGIGLFVFLWALTEFAIGSIGLLVMFIGIGEVVIYYVNKDKEPK